MKKTAVEKFQFESIGRVRSCFRDKFGVPRQPGLVPAAEGVIEFRKDASIKTALKGMEKFTHLWVIFVFHESDAKSWKPSVRPPRLGGAQKVGVLASRSPHRPNPIGMSPMKILEMDLDAKGGPKIRVSGVDLVDGTPVLDVKPYVPYADLISDAGSGWAEEPIERVPVQFSKEALEHLEDFASSERPRLRELAEQILALDPRPAFQKRKIPWRESSSKGRKFGFRVYDLDVHWEIRTDGFFVTEVVLFK